jgi:hypothetical protein
VSRDGYFLEDLNSFISTFCVPMRHDGFQGHSKAFHCPIQLNILKMLPETLLRIHFSVIGRCSLVPTSHWLQGKFASINLSQAASCMILQNLRRLHVSIFNVKIAACYWKDFQN